MRSQLVLFLVLALFSLIGCAGDPTPVADVAAGTPAGAADRQTDSPQRAPTASPPAPTVATSTATPLPLPTAIATSTATPPPTETPTPTPLPGASLIAMESHRDGNGEIYLLDTRTGDLTNLTGHPDDDRAPAWRPGGAAIAFESHRDGNWELYLLDLTDGSITRLTQNDAYDGAPAWNPDGTELAFESYRDGNLEIYVLTVAGGASGDQGVPEGPGGTPRRLTQDPAGDFGPAWSPDGRTLAFTSWRDGNKEIYVMPATGGEARNLTQHRADDEDAVWTPDGSALAFVSWRNVDGQTGNRNAEIYRLALADGALERLTDNPWPDLDPAWDTQGRLVWSAYDPGAPFETYDPYRPGDYHLYRGGLAGPERLTDTNWDDRGPAPAPAEVTSLEALAARLPAEPPMPTPPPMSAPGTLAQIVEMPSILASYAEQPIRVSELVAPSLVAWQQDLLDVSGWDLLRMTLGSWRSIDSVRKKEMYAYDYGYLSWHKAGRALDLALEYKVDGADQMVLSREDLGENVYWRMYLRTARQDGTQGEPLKENPWLYWWHIVPDAEPEAYDAGGKRLPIPAGYYVDVTALAKRHGWERIACYAIEGDYHWGTDSNGTEYWHYERTDGLIWWEAMGQVHPLATMEEHVGWEAGLRHAQSEPMMRSKGIPTPKPQ